MRFAMTVANKITITRICLIPAFVGLAWAYGRSFVRGQPIESYRVGAIATFLIAACSDGIDGFVARRFNQQSRLGTILDPVADKGLVSSALIVLTVAGWPRSFPFWFPYVVIGRDLFLALGFTVLTRLIGRVVVQPSLAGKLATIFQLGSILWVLLAVPRFRPALLLLAVALTAISGAGYTLDGIRQFRQSIGTSAR